MTVHLVYLIYYRCIPGVHFHIWHILRVSLHYLVCSQCVFTVFGVTCSGDDGHSDHHQAGGAPKVLHEELFQHDVPESLQQDLMDLRRQRHVAPLQLGQLHLRIKCTQTQH